MEREVADSEELKQLKERVAALEKELKGLRLGVATKLQELEMGL